MERWQERVTRSEFKNKPNANASFKGVPFILLNSKVSFGRRLVPHTYPGKDVPYTEDLGRRVRMFNIQGTILGGDFLTDRDSLVAACESEGVGDLINPYFGNIRALCQDLKFDDNIKSVRNSKFEAVFIEIGELTFPTASPDTKGAVETAAKTAMESQRNPFLAIYNIAKEPLVFTREAIESLSKAFAAIEKAKRANIGSEFFRNIKNIRARIDGIATSAEEVFDSITELITFGIFDNENFDENIDHKSSFEGLVELLEFKSIENPNSENSKAIDFLVQQAATITMALNSAQIEFDSANEARDFRNTILQKLDDLIFRSVSSDQNLEFTNLRTVVTQDVNSRSIVLPELKKITPKKTIPSIVLSQSLYGNKDRADDIVTRNNIEHPGFIPGGDDLEVLLDV